jgi:hypothetical protein
MAKTSFIMILCSDEDKELVQKVCLEKRLSLSSFCLGAVLEKIKLGDGKNGVTISKEI